MHLSSIRNPISIFSVLLCLAAAAPARAGEPLMLEEPPQYGIYYDRYTPAFYTGFAPRTLEPKRLHLHVGRGNQMRATVVLSDQMLDEYARDLVLRHDTYRALVDTNRMLLEQNRGFDEFERTIADAKVIPLVAASDSMSPAEWREQNLALMEKLNPGRVFRIRIPLEQLMGQWVARLRPEDAQQMDGRRQLELLNAMLPTRMFVAEMPAALTGKLRSLVQQGLRSGAEPGTLKPAYVDLLQQATRGYYPVRGDALEFTEFTAIWPIGTWNSTTTTHGREIPAYPTPGLRALINHQRTKTEDHVADVASYSWFPWLPYIHIGTRMHDAFHTLWWSMPVAEAKFLPASWREARGDQGKPRQFLWLLSRGPMSHGCTHVNGGHISELRQMLPADSHQFPEVDVFYNTSFLYDVFDIDGNLEPEVMGVKYFIAFSLAPGDKPDKLRVRNERSAYYDWLYAGELAIDERGLGSFSGIQDARYVGKSALPGETYKSIRLYEAEYEPEKIQFYKMVDVNFAKELRKVDQKHPFPGVQLDVAMNRRSLLQ